MLLMLDFCYFFLVHSGIFLQAGLRVCFDLCCLVLALVTPLPDFVITTLCLQPHCGLGRCSNLCVVAGRGATAAGAAERYSDRLEFPPQRRSAGRSRAGSSTHAAAGLAECVARKQLFQIQQIESQNRWIWPSSGTHHTVCSQYLSLHLAVSSLAVFRYCCVPVYLIVVA